VRPRAPVKHRSPYSDDEDDFSLARPHNIDFAPTATPDSDPSSRMSHERNSAAEAAYRSRIGSDFAAYQATFPQSHCAAAHANVTHSSPPDLQILIDSLPIADLARIHAYIMKTLWALRYLITLVLRECIPGDHDTSRIRQIFSDEASLDRHLARRIRATADAATILNSDSSAINPVSIALADPCLGPHALAILEECVPYDYDPTIPLAAQIAALDFSSTPAGLTFGGLAELLTLSDNIAKLPHSTLTSLDLRTCYKALAMTLVPHRQHSFRYRYRGVNLDWGEAVSDILTELRASGSTKISFQNFFRLVTLLDDYQGAFIDFANSYRAPQPKTHAIAALSTMQPPTSPDRPMCSAAPAPTAHANARADYDAYLRVSAILDQSNASSHARVAALHSRTAPSHPHARDSRPANNARGRGPPRQPQPSRAAAPAAHPAPPHRDRDAVKLKCKGHHCEKSYHPWYLACPSCGLANPSLTACINCPGEPLSVGTCNTCFAPFDPTNSRLASRATDASKLETIAHAARSGTMFTIMPPRFPHAPRPRVHALSIAPQADPSSSIPANVLE